MIRECNYQPSTVARNLSRQETHTVGVVIPEANNAFYGEILSGMSTVVDEHDLMMVFCNTENNSYKEKNALRMLEIQRVQGLVLAPVADYRSENGVVQLKRTLLAMGIPVVLLDRQIENLPWDGVYFDNYNGAYMACEQLIREGHRKIGTITGNLRLLLGQQRFNGYLQALSDYNIPLSEPHVLRGDFTTDTAYRLTRQMIASGNLPDAVFLSNNLTAIGFLHALMESGLRLGEDICCIGFDHIEALEILNIRYSYVDRDARNMGKIAMQMLLERIRRPTPGRREHIIPAQMVLRGSEKSTPHT